MEAPKASPNQQHTRRSRMPRPDRFRHFFRTKACPALGSIVLLRESVFKFAFLVAVPCGIVASIIKLIDEHVFPEDEVVNTIIVSSAYGSFTFLLSMLTVFRTSQSYSRYWDGVDAAYQMMSDFFDVASSVCSFLKMSKAGPEGRTRFTHTIVRLFSLLHALILAELAEAGPKKKIISEGVSAASIKKLRLIELEGLDAASRAALATSTHKIDLVFQWIQSLLVESLSTGVINVPPPILTRAFQELNDGMSQYHRCLKIAESPFPFPYTAASEMILIMHWIITPLVVATWTQRAESAFVLAFMQVFVVWSLHSIAAELEDPFEGEEHDLNTAEMQDDLNARLLMLLSHSSGMSPSLQPSACLAPHLLKQMLHNREGGTLEEIKHGRVDHGATFGGSDGTESTPTCSPRDNEAVDAAGGVTGEGAATARGAGGGREGGGAGGGQAPPRSGEGEREGARAALAAASDGSDGVEQPKASRGVVTNAIAPTGGTAGVPGRMPPVLESGGGRNARSAAGSGPPRRLGARDPAPNLLGVVAQPGHLSQDRRGRLEVRTSL